jgi:hypothetical protein
MPARADPNLPEGNPPTRGNWPFPGTFPELSQGWSAGREETSRTLLNFR